MYDFIFYNCITNFEMSKMVKMDPEDVEKIRLKSFYEQGYLNEYEITIKADSKLKAMEKALKINNYMNDIFKNKTDIFVFDKFCEMIEKFNLKYEV